MEDQIAKSLLGSRGFVNYLMPGQVLNYIEAHDNYNLNDLMHHLHPHDSPEDIEKRIYLANALNLSMKGMCFMQLGQEFQRTKMVATGEDGNYTEADVKRAMNSYNAPDEVNQVDWNQVTLKKDLVAKVAKLIERKQTDQNCHIVHMQIFTITSMSQKRSTIQVLLNCTSQENYVKLWYSTI